MTDTTHVSMPPMVVDRSTELRRNTRTLTNEGTVYKTQLPNVDECVRGDGGNCVLADAIKKVLPGAEPHVEGENPYVMLRGRRISLTISADLIDAIGRFDRGEPNAFSSSNVFIRVNEK